MKKPLDATEIKEKAEEALSNLLAEAIICIAAKGNNAPSWSSVRTAIETLAPEASGEDLLKWADLSLQYGLTQMGLDRFESLKYAFLLATKATSK